MVFSPDGRLFACGAGDERFCIWEESSSGYTLHRGFIFAGSITASFSPNGRSFTVQHAFQMQLRHTRDPPPSASSVLNQSGCHTNFILGFSPDEGFAAATRFHEDTITILDLASGKPRLTVDAGMAILCLRVVRDHIVAVGEGKIVTWKLPTAHREVPQGHGRVQIKFSSNVPVVHFRWPGSLVSTTEPARVDTCGG